MRVNGRNIGKSVDALYDEIEERTRNEVGREVRLREREAGAISNVSWRRGRVTISIHKGMPTHAVPHALAVALQHVRQRLDEYPDVHRPFPSGTPQADLVRTALRELVMAPEAESQLKGLELDDEWETEQRHEGMKALLRDVPKEWHRTGSLGHKFAALQYARMELQHPRRMWSSLKKTFAKELPTAAEQGADIAAQVKKIGWASPDACLESLVTARDALKLKKEALIGDRRTAEMQ